MPPDRVLLLDPRGTCGGVDAAVSALAWLVLLDLPSRHCLHHIVHNEHVVARFEALGVSFVAEASEVPDGATVLLSAHGTPPPVVQELRARCPVVVDAVCPLVAKVHREVAARHAAGDRILYVGRAGHDETDAVLALAPAATVLVDGAGAIEHLPATTGRGAAGVAVLAQTTLRVEEVEAAEAAARQRFGPVWTPPRRDVCDASSTRQAAVRLVAGACDVVVVVGSATSSNTESLVLAARAAGAPRAIRVGTAADLPADLGGTVAVTAGASTPDWLVDEVVAALDPGGRAEVVTGPQERTARFPLPGAVRRLVEDRARRGTLAPELAALAADPGTSAEALLRHAEARLAAEAAR
jgi:4-hydroxy-3-methylbut-2-enyl diphosphate reductase